MYTFWSSSHYVHLATCCALRDEHFKEMNLVVFIHTLSSKKNRRPYFLSHFRHEMPHLCFSEPSDLPNFSWGLVSLSISTKTCSFRNWSFFVCFSRRQPNSTPSRTGLCATICLNIFFPHPWWIHAVTRQWWSCFQHHGQMANRKVLHSMSRTGISVDRTAVETLSAFWTQDPFRNVSLSYWKVVIHSDSVSCRVVPWLFHKWLDLSSPFKWMNKCIIFLVKEITFL